MTKLLATLGAVVAAVLPPTGEEEGPLRSLPAGVAPRPVHAVCAYGYQETSAGDRPIVICTDRYEDLPAMAKENAIMILDTVLWIGGSPL